MAEYREEVAPCQEELNRLLESFEFVTHRDSLTHYGSDLIPS